ncbi:MULTISPECIES: hypothetical protein [unclassified Pseudofrankia]|uniref:hypothetical protein n=1 Tax=unclassified Pseudofrankia TaxID=2994372 RepID=UPI0008DA14F6|nr:MULTISPECIES: hypothetical protein [unclassified Pseudofrankia]MDT3440789.1 hypothetical protein [Pseudofrankia sp. BMG5.37]OHV59281.1 hypothetical protein BCD48_41520 [Pseudofrankia sp. BMG5.36]
MRNHGEKTKDMAESVLPSTARRSARQERRRIHQRQRARERNLMVVVRGNAEHDDGNADFREVIRRRDITQMVWDRRGADKIGSLVRWAGSRVDRDDSLREASVDEQVQYFARLLPDNLIGRHAVQHIESELEHRARSGEWRERRATLADRLRRERAQLADDLRTILDAGRHRELNQALRAGYLWEARGGSVGARPHALAAAVGRLVLGAHDVDDFVTDVAGRHPWIPDLARRLASEVG